MEKPNKPRSVTPTAWAASQTDPPGHPWEHSRGGVSFPGCRRCLALALLVSEKERIPSKPLSRIVFGSFGAPYGESFHDSHDGFYVSSYKLDSFLQVWYPYGTCYGLSGIVTEYVSPVLFSVGRKTQTPSWQRTLLLWEMGTGERMGRGGGWG